jgi:hypothetical protein
VLPLELPPEELPPLVAPAPPEEPDAPAEPPPAPVAPVPPEVLLVSLFEPVVLLPDVEPVPAPPLLVSELPRVSLRPQPTRARARRAKAVEAPKV